MLHAFAIVLCGIEKKCNKRKITKKIKGVKNKHLLTQYMHELSYHILEKQEDTVTGLVVVVLGFTSHQQLRSYGDGYRTGNNHFNTLFLFFINWIGHVISLDCQYIIRVAEESFLFVPSFQNQIADFLHVQYKGLL